MVETQKLLLNDVNYRNNNQVFLDFDASLEKLVINKCELLDLRKSLRTETGQIKVNLYEDLVHLNHDGSEVLARQIFSKVALNM